MKSGRGRRPSDNPKSETIIIRLEKSEKDAFEEYCKKHNTTMSGYVRGLIQKALTKKNK